MTGPALSDDQVHALRGRLHVVLGYVELLENDVAAAERHELLLKVRCAAVAALDVLDETASAPS